MTPGAIARVALAAAALPLVLGVVAVRPAGAQTGPVYDSYSLTGVAAAARTNGDVGAGGGLATLDTATGSVSARVDSAPSTAVLSAPVEPGTLVRTVVGQGNAAAGEPVFDVPDAEAQFPGSQLEAELTTVPASDAGVASARGGSATAEVTETSAMGTATGQVLDVSGLVRVDAATSEVSLSAAPAKATTTSTARASVGRVVVAGVLVLNDVVAMASLTAKGDQHVPVASLVVGGATVGGQAVEISDRGVTAADTPLVPGQSIEDANAQVNAALAAAGISVSLVDTTTAADARSATADTGSLTVRLTTPDLPNGIPGNRLEVVLGGVALTATDSLAAPVLDSGPPVDVGPVDLGGDAAPSTTTTFVPGTPGTPGTPGGALAEAGPLVAAPPAQAAGFVVAGRQLPAAVALAAFAAWQFLSLGTATLYAVVDRRRRATLAEAVA
jgi:hypothetical protein